MSGQDQWYCAASLVRRIFSKGLSINDSIIFYGEGVEIEENIWWYEVWNLSKKLVYYIPPFIEVPKFKVNYLVPNKFLLYYVLWNLFKNLMHIFQLIISHLEKTFLLEWHWVSLFLYVSIVYHSKIEAWERRHSCNTLVSLR